MSDDNSSNDVSWAPTGDSGGADVVAAPEGIGARIANSFSSVLIGLLFVIGSTIGLFWNENNAVEVAKALKEGAATVQTAATDRVDAFLDGRLVHASGETTSARGVADPDLGLATAGLKLSRKVEMYQWHESEKGSGNDHRFVYERQWSTSPINSEGFHAPQGHSNPPFRLQSGDFSAADARIGALAISSAALAELPTPDRFLLDDTAVAKARSVLGARTRADMGGLYVGQDPASPHVGDLRISWTLAHTGPASFVGRQQAGTIVAHTASNGREILLADRGIVPADAMFKEAQNENRIFTWIIRGVGLLFMLIGFSLFFAPVQLLTDWIPIVGSLVQGAVFLVSLTATVVLGSVVIAVAWFAARPLLAIGVLVAGGAIAWGLSRRRAAKQAAGAASAARA